MIHSSTRRDFAAYSPHGNIVDASAQGSAEAEHGQLRACSGDRPGRRELAFEESVVVGAGRLAEVQAGEAGAGLERRAEWLREEAAETERAAYLHWQKAYGAYEVTRDEASAAWSAWVAAIAP